MCVSAKRLRDDLVELGFHVLDRLSRSEPSPVTYTEHVGIDGKGFFAERSVETNICSLPSDAGKRLEVVARAGDLAVVLNRPIVLIAARSFSSPSATICSGVLMCANSGLVAMLTLASVACAERTTATRSV